MSARIVGSRIFRRTVAADKLTSILNRHWLLIFNAMYGLFIGLTVVAPLLMALGLEKPARLLYPLLEKAFVDEQRRLESVHNG